MICELNKKPRSEDLGKLAFFEVERKLQKKWNEKRRLNLI